MRKVEKNDERYQSWQFRSEQATIERGALNLTMKTFDGSELAFKNDTELEAQLQVIVNISAKMEHKYL